MDTACGGKMPTVHSHYVDFDDVTQSPLLLLKKLEDVYDIILYPFTSKLFKICLQLKAVPGVLYVLPTASVFLN